MTDGNANMGTRKPKLTVEEQIEHLKSKGVTFELCSEKEAAECLSEKTYYFKLAAYRTLFDKRAGGEHDGEYVGLDFGHLRDLAAIDHMLRYTLLPMTLDVEHFAKVKLMRGLTERSDEDGYSIVEDYLSNLDKRDRNLRLGEVSRLQRDRYGGSMASKYAEDPPAWALIELLSFGGFASFYLYCAKRWGERGMKSEHYLLRQAQAVRNACAHSTDIVNGFTSGEPSAIRTPKEVAVALGEIGVNKRARRSKMANPRIQQITMVAYAYRELVTGAHSREMCRELVGSLISRIHLHADWYENVDSVRSSFDFLTTVFDNWI
jgi:abortive infection bacteriophage resistance protein